MPLGNCLYAIGGMDSPKAGHWGNPLKTVERYDPQIDQWTEVAPMNEARFGSAVVAYQVSGEYSMLICSSKNNIIDLDEAIVESLLSIKRAGANLIISYFTNYIAKKGLIKA